MKKNVILENVLDEIKYKGKLNYSCADLLQKKCQYAVILSNFLKKSGIIDDHKNLLVPDFENKEIIEKLIHFNSERQAKYTQKYKLFKNGTYNFSLIPDQGLVQELRNRGYIVTCEKIVKL